ncbi:MAG: hypothetical protein R3C68_12645 [Myxococcota bacterium]
MWTKRRVFSHQQEVSGGFRRTSGSLAVRRYSVAAAFRTSRGKTVLFHWRLKSRLEFLSRSISSRIIVEQLCLGPRVLRAVVLGCLDDGE